VLETANEVGKVKVDSKSKSTKKRRRGPTGQRPYKQAFLFEGAGARKLVEFRPSGSEGTGAQPGKREALVKRIT